MILPTRFHQFPFKGERGVKLTRKLLTGADDSHHDIKHPLGEKQEKNNNKNTLQS